MKHSSAIHCYDVFDTVLTRIWARPTDLFWELGKRLEEIGQLSISVEEWVILRIRCECEGREKFENFEIRLSEIYDHIANVLQWSPAQTSSAIALEFELEEAGIRPIPAIQQEIAALHNKGENVCYISDTYLSSQVIRRFLDAFGFWASEDKLYVSSDYRKNKAFGDLFKIAISDAKCAPEQLHHKGDNEQSDFTVPCAQGIKAALFNGAKLNRYENVLLNSNYGDIRFVSLLAGVSRLTRLQNLEYLDPHHRVIWETTSNVAAPLLFGYVWWILLEAKKLGIERLYFLARDGEVLLKVAQILVKEWNIPIECRYLYASRQAWHLPSIEQVDDPALDWILAQTDFLSVASVLKRIEFEPQEIEEDLVLQGFMQQSWHRNLTHDERIKLRSVLLKDAIQYLIVQRAKQYRKRIMGYLKQERILDEGKVALVDIGWNGSLQRSLSLILKAEGAYPKYGITGLYFGLFKRSSVFPEEELRAYFFDAERQGKKKNTHHLALLEVFMAATHGATMSFDLAEHAYEPVLRSRDNASALRWGLECQQKAVMAFAEQAASVFAKDTFKREDWLKTSNLLLIELLSNPSKDEADVYGSFLVAEDQNESMFYELAPKYDLRAALRWMLKGQHRHQNVWFSASLKRSNVVAKACMALRLRLDEARHLLKDAAG